MNEIKQLNKAWKKFCEEEGKKYFKCERCGDKIVGEKYNKHLWVNHFLWIFCRRIGIHYQIHQLKRKIGGVFTTLTLFIIIVTLCSINLRG